MADPQNEGETLRFIDASRAMTDQTTHKDEVDEIFRQHDWDEGKHELASISGCKECHKQINALITKGKIELLEYLRYFN